MKRFLGILLLVVCSTHFCQKYTEGFTIAKISSYLLEEKPTHVDEELLEQPYHYRTKGGQSYVFLSEDGRFVLKLTRSSRLQNYRLLSRILPSAKFIEKVEKEEQLLKKTLESHHIAYTFLREETGILAIHLTNDLQLKNSIQVIDKLGIRHKIDPNLHPFIIQKRVTPVKEKIAELMDNHQLIESEILLRRLFTLLLIRKEKGIEDEDPNLSKNFGFWNEDPTQIDTGRFTFNQGTGSDRVANSKEDLQHWLNAYYPSLSESFDNAYKDYINGTL